MHIMRIIIKYILMSDIELYILSLFYLNYSINNVKATIKTNDDVEQIINKYNKYKLVDTKKTINLY
jgi:hypothetical protein